VFQEGGQEQERASQRDVMTEGKTNKGGHAAERHRKKGIIIGSGGRGEAEEVEKNKNGRGGAEPDQAG